MTLISRAAARLASRQPAAAPDVQAAPASIAAAGLPDYSLKIDHVVRIDEAVLVGGWATAPGPLRLSAGGRPLRTQRFQTSRPDVARYLELAKADGLGFVLLAEEVARRPLLLECLDASGEPVAAFPLLVAEESALSRDAQIQLAPGLASLRESMGLGGGGLQRLDSLLSAAAAQPANGYAAGAIDDARASPEIGQAVVSGWLVRLPGVEAWLEDAQGRRFALDDAHWIYRQDVHDAVGLELGNFTARSGFLLPLEGVAPGDRIRLKAGRSGETVALAEVSCASWGLDPILASRWLFDYPTSLECFAERVRRIDLPMIEPLMQARQRSWPDLPVQIEEVGIQVASPTASIIVPLYGRFDFVEHQLIEFARDPWLNAHAEILYVIDDRALVGRMAAEAYNLQRLYGVPFRWIWGSANRGFSGANNLGAAHARGQHLVFLNSDAFPRQPGWAQALLAALDGDPALGAVGPRLLFADGSIQHAGMEFRRREDLGIWINHHPHMGLDPVLDPHTSLTDVPCVTGACLAMRRADFESIEGWDTGYLIGDFEDSDLCLKLRARGMWIGYLPGVELTHLERQSFKLLGEGDYRMRVVIYNAVRHEQRWQESIVAIARAQEHTQ